MSILLVEPDKILGVTVKAALENSGYAIVWKKTAQTALDAIDEKAPDLIILEIQLGLHNGIELLYEAASYTEWQQIPVIIHTINAKALDSQYAESFKQLNVKSVLYKPKTSTYKLLQDVSRYSKNS